jgi:hypothetical protein
MSYKKYTVKVYADGTKHWYLNGKHHREDGPAVEWVNGTKYWFQNGNLHREDGPAIELANGTKRWFLNGNPHREDGPAVEYSDGTKRWFLNGIEYTETDFKKKTSPVKELTVSDLEKLLGYPVKIVKE